MIALELGGGPAFVLGILAKLVAVVLAAYSKAAIAVFLLPPAIDTMFTRVLAMLGINGGVVCYTALRSRRLSVDRTFFKKRAAHSCRVRG